LVTFCFFAEAESPCRRWVSERSVDGDNRCERRSRHDLPVGLGHGDGATRYLLVGDVREHEYRSACALW
ncbi:hypothetical protein, partial [Mycolicibacterium chlorophenolicum]|uniref:hypothetical protein n=1 Tax=Mycolicibacterium chlorophenolicum TaxID=37916 RepID=UPI001C3F46F7